MATQRRRRTRMVANAVEGYFDGSVFRPIRASADYDAERVGESQRYSKKKKHVTKRKAGKAGKAAKKGKPKATAAKAAKTRSNPLSHQWQDAKVRINDKGQVQILKTNPVRSSRRHPLEASYEVLARGTRTGKRVKTNPLSGSGPANNADATELYFFITSDSGLYRQQHLPIIKNLRLKQVKGVYDHGKAVKLFRYLVDNGAKKYDKEHGEVAWSTGTRNLTAERLTRDFETEAEAGNYDDLLPKAWRKKLVEGKANPKRRR